MSADGDSVREFIETRYRLDPTAALAALARLEAAADDADAATVNRAVDRAIAAERRARDAEAQRDALAEALRTICDIGETRNVEVARSALAEAGLE